MAAALLAAPLAVSAQAAPAEGPVRASLVGANGQALPLESLRGRWVWLYLGFTHCPGVCPFAMDLMAREYERLARPDEVQPLFVSLDPGRDTPAVIEPYVRSFNPAFAGATAPAATLDALVTALGTSYQLMPAPTPGGNYMVAHPNTIFLIDPEGRLIKAYTADLDAPVGFMADDLNEKRITPSPVVLPDTGAAWCGLAVGEYAPLMERARTMGSGTSVLPAASPMRMWSWPSGDWLWMLHGDAVAGYNHQNGPRGADAWAAENWAMLMGTRPLGPGLLDVRAMGSLEPFTLPPGGTPQLFQTGETWQGKPLIDKQHPHDLFMELSGRYTWNVDAATALFGYAGLAGEPALGPGAYMHRPSAADNHWAPLGHHLQDATHVSYGVLTAGARRGDFQLEGSLFNGREPDENRVGFDFGPLDSWSARLSYFPGRQWAMQVSYGALKSPEAIHPGDVQRATASITHTNLWPWGRLSTSLIWGQNIEHPTDTPLTLSSLGLESQADLGLRHHLYGRAEWVDKIGLPPGAALNHLIQRVNAYTLGYVWDAWQTDRFDLGLGADGTLAIAPALTAPVYGELPWGARVYLRLRPPTMRHQAEERQAGWKP